MWPIWLNGLLGLWLIVLTVLHHVTWNIGFIGLVITLMSLWTMTHPRIIESPAAIPHRPSTGQ